MNRTCNGVYFKINGVDLYRCLFDGTVAKAGDRVWPLSTPTCSNCSRQIVIESDLGEVEHKTIRCTIREDGGRTPAIETCAHLIRHDDLFNGEWTQIHVPPLW